MIISEYKNASAVKLHTDADLIHSTKQKTDFRDTSWIMSRGEIVELKLSWLLCLIPVEIHQPWRQDSTTGLITHYLNYSFHFRLPIHKRLMTSPLISFDKEWLQNCSTWVFSSFTQTKSFTVIGDNHVQFSFNWFVRQWNNVLRIDKDNTYQE